MKVGALPGGQPRARDTDDTNTSSHHTAGTADSSRSLRLAAVGA